MAEEFNNINQPGNQPGQRQRSEEDLPAEGRPATGGLKSLIVFLVLVFIVAVSFYVSFQLGSRILSPVRKSPGQKISVAIPDPPVSIAALQKLQAIMSQEAGKGKPVVAKTQSPLPFLQVVGGKTPASRTVAKVVRNKRLTGKHFYKVQVGFFEDKAAADQLGAKVRESGFDLFVKKTGHGWRVQAGAYRTKDVAEELRGELAAKGFSSQIIYE